MNQLAGKKRNGNLDLVKILACIFVIGLHSLNYPKRYVLYTFYQAFGYAIPCFFMASGYMLLNKKGVTWKYVTGKILRAVRFVLMWNLLWYGLRFAKDIVAEKVEYGAIVSYIINCLKAVPNNCFFQRGFFSHFWYMGTTIILYILLPALYRAKRLKGEPATVNKHNRLIWIWIFLLIVSIVFQVLSMFLGFPVQKKVFQSLRLWCSLQYFLAGGFMPEVINVIKRRITQKQHVVLLVLSVIASVAFRITIGIKCIDNSYAEFFYDDPLFIVSSYILFTFIMRLHLPSSVQKIVSVLCPLTMGVYAVHMIVLFILQKIIQLGNALNPVGLFIACVAVSFCSIKLVKTIPFSKYWIEL